MTKLSIKDLDLQGKKVLMRVDFNVPINLDGTIGDDTRIRLALPSIEYVLSRGGKLILMSHFGRPEGKADPKLSLKPCAIHLSKLLGKDVLFVSDCIGENAKISAEKIRPGEAILLENLRFHEGEEHPEKDPEFAKKLSLLGDLYVNDAFGAAHRSHASITAITEYFPKTSSMGFLMEKEVAFLSQLVLDPKHPFYAIIGGAKIGTKLGVLKSLIKKIDAIFIGGGMAFTFLKGEGVSIGDSICDHEKIDAAQNLLKKCDQKGVRLYLPIDLVITDGHKIKTVLTIEGIPDGWKGMDVGPKTIEKWSMVLQKGSTIFWNGPLGVFEQESFSNGTNQLAQNLSTMSGIVIAGGGDSIAAINALGLGKKFNHLSTGGGASLEYIEHGHLPGIDALTSK